MGCGQFQRALRRPKIKAFVARSSDARVGGVHHRAAAQNARQTLRHARQGLRRKQSDAATGVRIDKKDMASSLQTHPSFACWPLEDASAAASGQPATGHSPGPAKGALAPFPRDPKTAGDVQKMVGAAPRGTAPFPLAGPFQWGWAGPYKARPGRGPKHARTGSGVNRADQRALVSQGSDPTFPGRSHHSRNIPIMRFTAHFR